MSETPTPSNQAIGNYVFSTETVVFFAIAFLVVIGFIIWNLFRKNH
jgi:hypothetical protein